MDGWVSYALYRAFHHLPREDMYETLRVGGLLGGHLTGPSIMDSGARGPKSFIEH